MPRSPPWPTADAVGALVLVAGWAHYGQVAPGRHTTKRLPGEARQVLKRTSNLRKKTDKSFYDPTGLPGQNHRRFTEPEWLWTSAVRWLKQLLRR